MIQPMEAWRYWVIIGICLCVAAYMFLSLFYPPLRWMFRLKRSASYVLNVDEDQNAKFGNSLGLILAPIIGVVMLWLSGTAFMEMRSSERRSIERGVATVAKKEKSEKRLALALGEWKVSRVYLYDRRKKRDADEAGVLQSEKFVRSLAELVSDGVVLEKPQSLSLPQDWLSIELTEEKPQGSARVRVLTLFLDPKKGKMAVRFPAVQKAEQLQLPAGLRDQAAALGNIKIIDLDVLEKEKRKQVMRERKQKEQRLKKLAAYHGKTRLGPLPWELRQKSHRLHGQEGENDFIKKHTGVKIDWDLRVSSVRWLKDGRVETHGMQSQDKSNGAFYIQIKATKENFPSTEEMGDVWWLRIKGRIQSVKDARIIIDVDEAKPFVPDV